MDQRKPTAEDTDPGVAERVWKSGAEVAELLAGTIKRAGQDAASGLQRAGEDTMAGLQRAGERAAPLLQRAGKDAVTGLQRAGKDAVTGLQRAGQEVATGAQKLQADVMQNPFVKRLEGAAQDAEDFAQRAAAMFPEVASNYDYMPSTGFDFSGAPLDFTRRIFSTYVPQEIAMRRALFGPDHRAVFDRRTPSRAEAEEQGARNVSEMQTAIESRRPSKDAYKEDWSNYAADISRYGGLSPDFTTAVIMKESTGNPNAVAVDPKGRITAVGLYQFTDATGEEFGLIERDASGKIIRDDRADPFKATDAFVRLTQRNTQRFKQLFKRTPSISEMYMAHMMGPDGYAALYKSPDMNAVEALQKNLGISKGRASPMIWRNLPGRSDKEKQKRAENITAEEYILWHTGKFSEFIPKQKVPEYRDGGLIGPGGMPMRRFYDPQATPRMQFGYNPPASIPPARAEMPEVIAPPMQTPTMPRRTEQPGLVPPPAFIERRFPSFQEGGMVGPGGMPMRPAGVGQQTAPTMSAQELDAEIQRMMAQNPQAVQQIQQEIMSAMQTGELTPQELNMMVQLATLAAQNPQMYPQIRQFAIQQGIATEEDLGPTYDQGLVFVILLASKAAQQQAQGGASISAGQVPQAAMQPPVASMMNGGPLPQKSMNADGSVPIIAHEGEYVIPKEIVMRKGTDFFDKLIGKDQNATGDVK
jgi:hypothetical protein